MSGTNKIKLLSLAVFFATSLGCRHIAATSAPRHVFEQARVTETTAADLQAEIMFDDQCEGALLKNIVSRFYALVPQHCLAAQNLDRQSWCHRTTAVSKRFGDFNCKSIIASQPGRDLMVIELTRRNNGFEGAGMGLRLADFVPPKNTRLRILSQTGTVDNCWILKAPVESPYSDHEVPWNDPSALHNCSIVLDDEDASYSGASAVIEGTDVLLGMPTTTAPDDLAERDALGEDDAGFLALTFDVVRAFRTDLSEAGIAFASAATQGNDAQVGDYVAAGVYRSATDQTCDLLLVPLYHEGVLTGMKLNSCYKNGKPATWQIFNCRDATCQDKDGNRIEFVSKKSLNVTLHGQTRQYDYINGTAGDTP